MLVLLYSRMKSNSTNLGRFRTSGARWKGNSIPRPFCYTEESIFSAKQGKQYSHAMKNFISPELWFDGWSAVVLLTIFQISHVLVAARAIKSMEDETEGNTMKNWINVVKRWSCSWLLTRSPHADGNSRTFLASSHPRSVHRVFSYSMMDKINQAPS